MPGQCPKIRHDNFYILFAPSFGVFLKMVSKVLLEKLKSVVK
jgi:hypothetical protein